MHAHTDTNTHPGHFFFFFFFGRGKGVRTTIINLSDYSADEGETCERLKKVRRIFKFPHLFYVANTFSRDINYARELTRANKTRSTS